MKMNSPELTFNFFTNTVPSVVISVKLSFMLQLASSGNPAESDKKYSKVLLKVGKKAERYYRKHYSRYVNMMDSSVEHKVRGFFEFLFSF